MMSFEQLYAKIADDLRNSNFDSMKTLLNHEPVNAVIHLIRGLRSSEKGVVFRLLDKDKAIDVFERLDFDQQEAIVDSLQEDAVLALLLNLDPDDQARLLDELPAKLAKKLLASLPAEKRDAVNTLLGYPADTAGRIMTPDYLVFKGDLTVSAALDIIRTTGMTRETIYSGYIVDDKRVLEGVVSLKDLVLADGGTHLAAIMDTDAVRCSTHEDQESVIRKIQTHGIFAIPVVDKEQRLVGIITVDDAMDIQQEETTEDIMAKAGLIDIVNRESGRSTKLLSSNIFNVFSVRLPFLLLTLAGGMLAGAVIEVFEEALEAVAVLAIFIPVIMDMGGNVGTQSSTIFTRALVLGQIPMERFLPFWLRKIKNGLGMGVVLGVAGGLVATLWQGIPALGWAVGLSLFSTITIATSLGFIVPFILLKLGFDQAAGADPVITTVKDMSGLAIYFGFASYFLSALL